jgi:DNA-binding response OmpR family regulator
MSHVLLVEDDTAILDLLTDFLELEGQQICRATSASEARAWLAAETIDLMIADCLWPASGAMN